MSGRQETSTAVDKPLRENKKSKYRYPEPVKATQPASAQQQWEQQQQQHQQEEEMAYMTRSFVRSLSLNKSGRCRYKGQQANRQSVINNNDIYRPGHASSAPPARPGFTQLASHREAPTHWRPASEGEAGYTGVTWEAEPPSRGSQADRGAAGSGGLQQGYGKNTPPRRGYSTAL